MCLLLQVLGLADVVKPDSALTGANRYCSVIRLRWCSRCFFADCCLCSGAPDQAGHPGWSCLYVLLMRLIDAGCLLCFWLLIPVCLLCACALSQVWMCTGDNQRTADVVAKQLGIRNVMVRARSPFSLAGLSRS